MIWPFRRLVDEDRFERLRAGVESLARQHVALCDALERLAKQVHAYGDLLTASVEMAKRRDEETRKDTTDGSA